MLNDVGFNANGPLRTSTANRTPYEQSWSLGIERELPGSVLINAEYIGKKGTHLPFSGANQLNILGSQIESPSADINGLLTSVTNPFAADSWVAQSAIQTALCLHHGAEISVASFRIPSSRGLPTTFS